MSFESYFPRNFSSFCDLKFFPGFSLLFPGVPEIFWFESCSSRTTGNGLETDLASRGLRCLCCLCSHSLARCHLKAIFPEISQAIVI